MSRINRDIYTSLDVNGPYIRIDTQPISTTLKHNEDAVFTLAASTYYLTGDEAEIGDIDTLETDAVAPTDSDLDNQTPGVPHTAKNDGYISYQWYQIDANSTPIGEVTKLTDSDLYSGTTTNTLTVHNILSPGTHLNQYYCELDYIPNLTSGQYDTGNAVNDIVTSDTVTLNVRPYIIIVDQPLSTTTGLNPKSGTVTTSARLSDTRTPWENYRLEFQWWEQNVLNTGDVPDTRLKDGIFNHYTTTYKTEEELVSNIQRVDTIQTFLSETATVGIPTEAVSVSFNIAGANGGIGGNEDSSTVGGAGGKGRVGEFEFSSSELNLINNSSTPTEYIVTAGTKGADGAQGTSKPGGLGGFSFDENASATSLDNDSVSGGKGGDSGPGGVSGSGGGGGAGSGILRKDNGEWIIIAGGGGGGGGASKDAAGAKGEDAGSWTEFLTTDGFSEIKQATVINYNPIAGTRSASFVQDRVDYGIYIKTSSPISSVSNTTTKYRIVVVWNGNVVVNTNSSAFKYDTTNQNYYIESGSTRYYLSTHRGSQLGWCNDESNFSTVCIRGDGQYANAFDTFRSRSPITEISPVDGGNGVSKVIGDGGGGGGAGGGALVASAGGNPGADPISADRVNLTFKVTKNASNSQIGTRYIKFVENSWYGFPETQPSRGDTVIVNRSFGTQTVSLKTNTTYDVVSNFEEGDRTSDGLRILQDFTPNQNDAGDVIAGRSIGMDLSGGGDDEDDFTDFIVSVSDGSFDYSPETVRLDDGEIVGKAIIRFTTPAEVKNSTVATGGEGGESQWNSTRLNKSTTGDFGLNSSSGGSITMKIRTEQPFSTLEEEVTTKTFLRQYQISGSYALSDYESIGTLSGYSSNLTITSNYVFSKRILCQITVKDVVNNIIPDISFSNTLYTNIVDFIVNDSRDKTITVEQIRHNNDFAILSSMDLQSGDLTFERSTDNTVKETEYYSFYSNEDIEVDVKMYGGKGNNVGSFSGGEGGFSYLRLNMIANTEYVIAGLDEYVNTPFLFKKGRLLAVVGGGGDANVEGAGGRGGGVSIAGEQGPNRGGRGGRSTSTLNLDGVHGSASLLEPIAPDTKALETNAGRTIRCSKGNLFQFGDQPNPCEDIGTAVKFKLSDGTFTTNTKEINRGFKAGYNIFNTAGRGSDILNQGWGGSGATGGDGSIRRGGGGGSGFIAPDLTTDIFARSEGQSNQDGTDPITSTLGGSTGPARVEISLAEIPSAQLPEFIERPAEPIISVTEEDVIAEPVFIPLPEIIAPPPVDPPQPSLTITKVTSKGWSAGNKEYGGNVTSTIDVLESGSLEVNIETNNIPSNTKFYWKVSPIITTGFSSGADFDPSSGEFITKISGGKVISSFIINPKEDNQTEFIYGDHKWKFIIYSDPSYKYPVASFPGLFSIKDTSLGAPTASVSNYSIDSPQGGTAATRTPAGNYFNEGTSHKIILDTVNIPHGDTISWNVITNGNLNSNDFTTGGFSGTATVSSGFDLDANDSYAYSRIDDLINANKGTAEFNISLKEDQTTEGTEYFGIRVVYNSVEILNTTTGITLTFGVLDTSANPSATISSSTDDSGNSSVNVDEGSQITFDVSTQNMRNNEVIYWKIFKSDGTTNADAADFKDGITTGSVKNIETLPFDPAVGRRGSCSINVTTKADNTTEGAETFIINLYSTDEYNSTIKTTSGGSTDSELSFVVNDTSLTPQEYRITLTSSGAKNDGTDRYKESDSSIPFRIEVYNLRENIQKNLEKTFTFKVFNSTTGEPAKQSTSSDPSGDFTEIKTTVTLSFQGYTDAVGDYADFKQIPTGSHTIPVWSFQSNLNPTEDYLNDGDKYFEIKLYQLSTDADNDINVLRTSSEFLVENDVKPLYAFNSSYGWGVNTADKSGETIPAADICYNKPVSGGRFQGNNTMQEGRICTWRIESSAAPGTTLFYEVIADNNKYNDRVTGTNLKSNPIEPSSDIQIFNAGVELPSRVLLIGSNIVRYSPSNNYYVGEGGLSGLIELVEIPEYETGIIQKLPRTLSDWTQPKESKTDSLDTKYTRSVGWIGVYPVADAIGDGSSTNLRQQEYFKILVYDNPERTNLVAIQSGCEVRDSSHPVGATDELGGDGGGGDSGGGTLSSLIVEGISGSYPTYSAAQSSSGNNSAFILKWVIAGPGTGGEASGSGFDVGYYNIGGTMPNNWFQNDGSVIFSPKDNIAPVTLSFTLKVGGESKTVNVSFTK